MLLANGEDYRTNFTVVEQAAALFRRPPGRGH
jgi:hypothetical protein